jgi:serine/threonine protein kinase
VVTTLGSYELGEVLGRGAMGEVHRAVRAGSAEAVAVKVLRPELAGDPELIARFVQERTVLRSLEHPNLVRVRDLVVESGSAGIVMDLIDGLDVRKFLRNCGTLPPAEAARIVGELASALEVVHSKGVVHRDIKPENVLLDPDGGVRLTDFGIARLVHGPSLTRITGLIGTPEYLAPELAERDHATAASDVYATGILLYELLSGFTPFSGGHPVAVLRRHIEQDPTRPEGLPYELWDLVAAMLAKSPARRPGAAEVARRLQAMAPRLAGLPALIPARPARPDETPTAIRAKLASPQEAPTVLHAKLATAPKARSSRSVVVAAVALLVAAALVVGVVVATAGPPSAKQASFTFSPQSYPSGLIVDRTWRLSDKTGDQLLASATLTNGLNRAMRGHYDEVIPKQVAANVADVNFSPTPDQIIKADPVARYDFDLAAGASLEVTYRADVGTTTGSWSGRLAALAHDQAFAETAYLKATSPTTSTTFSTTRPNTTTTRLRAIHKKPLATSTSPATVPRTSPATVPRTSPATVPRTSPATVPRTSPATIPRTSPATIPRTSPATIPRTPRVVVTGSPGTSPTSAPRVVVTGSPGTSPTSAPRVVVTGSPGTSPTSAPRVVVTGSPGN